MFIPRILVVNLTMRVWITLFVELLGPPVSLGLLDYFEP